jgi:hypothetical protein
MAGLEKVRYELLLNAGHGDAAFAAEGNVQKVLDFLDFAMTK